MQKQIAAFCFGLQHWFYWDAKTQAFTLLEVEPGYLVRLKASPIVLERQVEP